MDTFSKNTELNHQIKPRQAEQFVYTFTNM